MGWSSGTDIVRAVAEVVNDNVSDNRAKRLIYCALVDAAVSADWDCLYEAEGIDPILDKVLKNFR